MPLAFHAAPPAGQWLNDPNALVAMGDEYRLLVQHRADEPAFRATGWALLTSTDLLDWRWRGLALPATRDRWAYSGSMVALDPPEIFHTVHDAASGMQHQVRLAACDTSWRSWTALPAASLPAPARNVRDPFVFAHGGGWRMLLARPCDWAEWDGQRASELIVLASDDRMSWREAGRIGPWHPPGIMWEVPVLIEREGRDLLLVSTIDRRYGRAACAVRGWSGSFDGATFHPDDVIGAPVDLGPDCYALIPGTGWPGPAPCVGWLSSWATAREPVWPGFAGGPVTLPRVIGLDERGGPTNRPWDVPHAFTPTLIRPIAGAAHAAFDGSEPFTLSLASDAATLLIEADPRTGTLALTRHAPGAFAWTGRHDRSLARVPQRTLTLFVDGPAVEIFIDPEGRATSFVLPGRLHTATLQVAGAELPLCWSAYVPPARRSADGDVP